MKQCLWCGGYSSEFLEDVCRTCWEKNQFPDPSNRDEDARED